ncbi:MAG: helix-turn-helix domain-containing protein, partial [Aeromicrobium sp.]
MATSGIRSFLSEIGKDKNPEVEKILDAALLLFADIGIQRATIGDVANRAGVNRVTVYRRIGSKDELVEAVILREATRLFSEVADAASLGETFGDRVAGGFATTILSMRQNA